MKAVRSSRRALRIVSQCATAEEFVAAFHPYLDRDSLFIATGSPEDPGQAVRFVLTLAGGETILRGAGRVVESHRDRANFYGLRGMKLQFDELDDGSRRALAALESRAGGKPRSATAARPTDVIECLIYDDPDTESADPASLAGRNRAAHSSAQHGLPLGDDDVTAVSQAPRPPRSAGTGPQPRQGARASRASGSSTSQTPVQTASPHAATQPPPHAAVTGRDPMSFIVPRPRTDPGAPVPEGVPGDPSRPMAAVADPGELPTDLRQAMPPRGAGPMPPAPPGPPGPHPAGLPRVSDPRLHHMSPDAVGFPSDAVGFASGEFTMPPTRTGVRRGVPRPPMPSERTELVRIRRPSYVRTAAVSATLGALLGLGAGYLLWGMNFAPMAGGAEESPAADGSKPAAATTGDGPAAAAPTTGDAPAAAPATTGDGPAAAAPTTDKEEPTQPTADDGEPTARADGDEKPTAPTRDARSRGASRRRAAPARPAASPPGARDPDAGDAGPAEPPEPPPARPTAPR
ncbi:MAG TPA: hypothetical protein VK698_26005 [Kofleriaceae bacterium]|nr:hypothetical protein [Kofleriaceae bacterium]